ncbi:XTP/dITP diphosphohydrolase/ATP diphosphatase [Granulicella pectinivorans]|uniref:XTP/dITP diphosphohydrolase/ATP diphosphatase n=1 Tax=Granulicella pectinivorans TaxID=474950 RepID=A0A1I6N144_9BACT|nr:XTP/dITP diphosphohydrolase/ATP diphosphatase [Granulicella pectinivorans]
MPANGLPALPNLPAMNDTGARVAEAAAIMAHLRGSEGCPWDREQTFDSIKHNTLEETYEVFDAIERRAWPELKDELGDMLLQVLFYAQMASEAGYFSMADVAAGLSAKLIRRHPHVFADGTADDPAAVQTTWDAVKAEEKKLAGTAAAGLLGDVSRAMPAMTEARKLGAKAAKVGFDWPDVSGLVEKLREETAELEVEIRGALTPTSQGRDVGHPDLGRVEDELGDLLFTAVNLARHMKLDPETALRRANAKFRGRFDAMETAAGGREALAGMSAEELDQRWRAAKLETA